MYGISQALTVPAPEPSSFALAAFGFFGLLAWGWRVAVVRPELAGGPSRIARGFRPARRHFRASTLHINGESIAVTTARRTAIRRRFFYRCFRRTIYGDPEWGTFVAGK